MKQTEKKEKEAGFFSEDNGNKSSMRLMSFTSLICAFLFGLTTIFIDNNNINGIYITFGFLIAAFAPKALQKFAETKLPTAKEEEKD